MTMETFGRYEIKRQLGRGGMATVYLAHDPRFGRDVALKVLPRQFLHDEQFRVRFEREARTIAKLEHKAIVPVYDFGEHDDQPYLVMRHMSGGSLEDRLQKGALSRQEIVRVIGRIAHALDAAHAQGVVHRDLKPGNILFDGDGDAYLSDFGIVKLSEATANITGNAIVGTPAYMSPEQVHGKKKVDARSDIYTLGVILYELITGKPPYQADTPTQVMMAHVLEPVPHLEREDVPADYGRVIERAMAKDTNTRFTRAGELAAALETAEGLSDKTVVHEEDRTVFTPDPFSSTTPIPAPPAELAEADATTLYPKVEALKEAEQAPARTTGSQTLSKGRKVAFWGCGVPTIVTLSIIGLCAIIVVAGVLSLGNNDEATAAQTTTPEATSTIVTEAQVEPAVQPTVDSIVASDEEGQPAVQIDIIQPTALPTLPPGAPTPYPFTIESNDLIPFEALDPIFELPPNAELWAVEKNDYEEAATFRTDLSMGKLITFYRNVMSEYDFEELTDLTYIDEETIFLVFTDDDEEEYFEVVSARNEGNTRIVVMTLQSADVYLEGN